VEKKGNEIELFGSIAVDITASHKSSENLRYAHDMFRYIIEHVRCAVAVHDRDLRYIYVSKRYLDEYGVKEADIIGRHHYDVFPELPEKWREIHKRVLAGEVCSADDDLYVRADGSKDWTRWECRPWHEADGSIGGLIVYTEVITEQKAMAEELLQSRKLESIGRLAGGVAHDFNNMLAVISGYTDMALLQLANSPDRQLFNNLREVKIAAERSAELTRQLLAFARQQTIAPKELDINKAVGFLLKMLGRLIGENIDLEWKPGTDLKKIFMDPSQLDQILTNMCINARDAIKNNGKVTIETADVFFDEAYCRQHLEFLPGEYVMLAVSDNGCGMEKEVLKKVFEPFFTTKEMGKGTGLGLATVYGIVRQNKGFINAYSEPGQGTTFKIYLPPYHSHEEPAVERKVGTVLSGNETLLLVEDEPSILNMIKSMLEMQGYTVLASTKPLEAIRLARENPESIDLLLTDVVMPEMNGRELTKQLHDFYPQMKTLYMSGYTANVIAHHGVLDNGVNFIHKPFSRSELSHKIREALEAIV
jgi:PAS domain S-box-containing protein